MKWNDNVPDQVEALHMAKKILPAIEPPTPSIDFIYLRLNGDIVYHLLALTVPEFEDGDSVFECTLMDTTPLLDELVGMYNFVPSTSEQEWVGTVTNELRNDVHAIEISTGSSSEGDEKYTRLHKNPLFVLVCVCRGVFMLTFIPLVTIIVDFAMDQGLSQDSGQYVISALSLGDLLGRLCLGWITDSGCLSLPRYMLVVMVCLGGCNASFPYLHSETSIMPVVLIFGMLQGSLFIRHQMLIAKYMEPDEQIIGMGAINLLSGFIGFTIPYYIGYFRDSLGSYDQMFYCNGAICAAIGLLWAFEPLLTRQKKIFE